MGVPACGCSNRSAALLQLGRKEEALEDALRATQVAPPGFHTVSALLLPATAVLLADVGAPD